MNEKTTNKVKAAGKMAYGVWQAYGAYGTYTGASLMGKALFKVDLGFLAQGLAKKGANDGLKRISEGWQEWSSA